LRKLQIPCRRCRQQDSSAVVATGISPTGGWRLTTQAALAPRRRLRYV
jgi:hypothetical protein